MSNPTVSCPPKPFQAGNAPTVLPASIFLAADDAQALWSALYASSVDIQTIINILGHRSLGQRLEITNEYKRLHNNASLIDDLKAKLSGDLEDLIVAMMTPTDQYLASQLNYAIAGTGTDEDDLIEILCTSTNVQITAMKRSYHQLYNVTLESDVIADTTDEFKDLLVSIIKTERDEWMKTDQSAAEADARAIQAATSDTRWTTFHDIFCYRSIPQLTLVFNSFESVTGTTIETEIRHGFTGDLMNGLLAIAASVKNPSGYFAMRLNASMAGVGTVDNDLVRLVVTRSEIDMVYIKGEYEKQFSRTLAADIIDETSGDYKTLLLILIGEEEAQTKTKNAK